MGVVALGTLRHRRGMVVIIGRSVARLTVGLPIMVKFGIIPIVGVMTIGALAGKMAARRGVTRLAIGKARMVEGGIAPIRGIVAGGTLT